jgi:hypothetical protein
MAIQAIMAGLNMAASAAPLFFGENNIFSGKARQANRELEKNFRESQSMQLPGEYTEAMQNLRMQANQGLPSAALGLYQQQAGRQQASQLGALGSRRSALAGIGGIAQAGQDAALNLASMQGQAMQAGQQRLNQGLMQMGGIQYQEALRKQQEAADYWGGRKAEANASVSSALKGIGQAAGSALAYGAFDKLGGQPSGGMNANQIEKYAQNQALARQQFQNLASTGLSSWGPLSPKALKWTPPPAYSPKKNP